MLMVLLCASAATRADDASPDNDNKAELEAKVAKLARQLVELQNEVRDVGCNWPH